MKKLAWLAYTTQMKIPFEFGFTLDGRLNALQAMLETVKGQPRTDKLSVIQLMEVDLSNSYDAVSYLRTLFNPWSRE